MKVAYSRAVPAASASEAALLDHVAVLVPDGPPDALGEAHVQHQELKLGVDLVRRGAASSEEAYVEFI